MPRTSIGDRTRTHGLSKHPLYFVMNRMKSCCYNSNHADYKNYGARGITVCSEWLNDFTSFYNWAMDNGYQKGLTIERINVNKGYSPDNCKWITNEAQANNRTTSHYITYDKARYTIKSWHVLLGLSCQYKLFHKHLKKYNFNIEKAVEHYHKAHLEKLKNLGAHQ